MDATISPSVPGPVVVGVDESDSSRGAVVWAAEYAARARLPLVLAHAWRVPALAMSAPLVAPTFVDPGPFADQGRRVLDDAAGLVGAVVGAGSVEVRTRLAEGFGGDLLGDEARRAALLVVGTHRRGAVGRFVLGSVADACVMNATGPVAVVPPEGGETGSADVVVGIDGSPAARAALRWALAEAGRRHARLVVVHACDTPDDGDDARRLRGDDARRLVEREMATVSRDGLRPRAIAWRVAAGSPGPVLVDAASTAGLLVVGRRGDLGPIERRLGSVSTHCVHHADGPLVVVPA